MSFAASATARPSSARTIRYPCATYTPAGMASRMIRIILGAEQQPYFSLRPLDFAVLLHLRERAIERLVRESEIGGEILERTWQQHAPPVRTEIDSEVVADAIPCGVD